LVYKFWSKLWRQLYLIVAVFSSKIIDINS
jgi:hypothetical protein